MDGTSEYVGNWKNGERHGEGTTYDPYGLVIYDGDWEENLPHGIGEYTYENGKVYNNKVELGRRLGNRYEVISGVVPGSLVVVAGKESLANEIEVEVIE